MSRKIGKTHFAIYSRLSKRLRLPTKKNTSQINASLERICKMFEKAPFDWYLVGGVGIDLYLGKMTRFHHDIDIEVPSENTNQLIDYIKGINYTLLQKVLSTNIPKNKRLVIYKEANIRECVPESKARYRLVNYNHGRIIDGKLNFLSYIDVSFTRQHGSGTEVGYHGRSIIMPIKYSGEQMVKEFKGNKIKLRDPRYHLYLKNRFESLIDTFDRDNLKRIIKQRMQTSHNLS